MCCPIYSTSIEHDSEDDFDNASTRQSSSGSNSEGSAVISLTEVHLGCTFEQILKAKGHVLEGGLLSLMVFPKKNKAPSDVYLRRFGGRAQCGLLNPVG